VVRAGTKKHSDLAKDLVISSLMLYPSHAVPVAGFFAETSCIAALEAQAAGCPVIASNRGALSESIKNGQTGVLIDGDPYSAEYKATFVKETVDLLNDGNRLEQMRKSSVNFIRNNYTWDLIAKEWSAKFEEMLK
jgi:glycosyltransferase involved in cell wall biosynthesis